MRVVQVLHRYNECYAAVPKNISIGFAAWLLFMKGVKKEGNVYWGEYKGQLYPIKDEMAGYFFDHWQNLSPDILVETVLSDTSLWDTDLTSIPGFTTSVTANLKQIMQQGILALINKETIHDD